ncbi:MAG: N-acetyl-alpha-D-glucosaminyl L-malate synthase BshA, partial [Balneola sp.]
LDDIDCMADNAVEILTNPELHDRMSKNARKRAELFNQDLVVNQYEDYYKVVRSELLSVS